MTTTIDPRAAMSTIVASVSGGKDSAAMCLYLRELGLTNVRRVFADTGWEHADTYAYLRGPLTEALGQIDEVMGADGGMENLIRRKGMFPSRQRKFCTEELKLFPLRDYIARAAEQGPVINAIGVRRQESKKRRAAVEWEWSDFYDCWLWRPIVDWTVEHVIDIHTRNSLAPNPRRGSGTAMASRRATVRRPGSTSRRCTIFTVTSTAANCWRWSSG